MINFLVFISLFFLDYYLKSYVSKNLKWNGQLTFLNNHIQILYVENRGIAFNLLENKKKLIGFANLTLLSYILYLYFYVKINQFALMLIFCGGLGNFVDRLKRGYVVDYFYFNIKKAPVFNFSDFYIIIGAILFSF